MVETTKARIPHCWKGNDEVAEETYGFGSPEWAEAVCNPATCMLMQGHEGPHEFVSDENIVVEFKSADQQELFDCGERSVLPQADRVTSGRTCTPASIGTGPKGETCGSCRHIVKVGNAKKIFKCGLVKKYWTHGEATDIKARWPSCSKWEPMSGENK